MSLLNPPEDDTDLEQWREQCWLSYRGSPEKEEWDEWKKKQP